MLLVILTHTVPAFILTSSPYVMSCYDGRHLKVVESFLTGLHSFTQKYPSWEYVYIGILLFTRKNVAVRVAFFCNGGALRAQLCFLARKKFWQKNFWQKFFFVKNYFSAEKNSGSWQLTVGRWQFAGGGWQAAGGSQ